ATTTGHGHPTPPTPVDILAAALRRSSAERSATETLRDELDRSEDPETLRRLHDQAMAHIEGGAGPNGRSELYRLRQAQVTLPGLRERVAVSQREVARLDRDIAQISLSLAGDQADLYVLSRPRRFRRPDHHAIAATRDRIHTQQEHRDRLHKERARAAADLQRNRKRLHETERTVDRIPAVEAALAKRRDWFRTHPDDLAWEADLDAIDLRTIDLSLHRPRTGLERRLDDALGIRRPDDPTDRLLRPPPGRGIDGPDIGLGL